MVGTQDIQNELESEAKEASIQKYINSFYKDLNSGNITDTKPGQAFLRISIDPISKKIREMLDLTNLTGDTKRDIDTLRQLCNDEKVLAYIVIQQLLPLVVRENNRVAITKAALSVMRGIYAQYEIDEFKLSDPKMLKYMDSAYRRASKKRKLSLMQSHIRNLQEQKKAAWGQLPMSTDRQNLRIGVRLIEAVIASGAGLFGRGTLRNDRNPGSTNVIHMTASGRDLLSTTYAEQLRRMYYTLPPLVVPPKPWTNNFDGGMHNSNTSIMKMKTPAGFDALHSTPLTKVYPVLNKLQETRWRINSFVVDVITDVFEGNMIDPRSPKRLPRLFGGLPTNTPVYAEDLIPMASYGIVDDNGRLGDTADFVRWRRDIEATKIALDGEMGRRIHLISALGEAQRYIDYDVMYFSYTLDSRGRVYTQQAIVTPQGSSEVKAMLEFADGQYLDERGVHWFKIHTANVYGKDKEDFHERLQWFDNNIANIRRVGTSPDSCLGDWAYCDSPFEFLAACKAWVDHEAGKPVHVPIQLDATNSGVQIYSGLLGDLEGAKTVNVVNTGKREDVYGIVAQKVNEALFSKNYPKMFHVTMSDGNEKSQTSHVEAESIAGKIDRKIVKRNVMTVPYSVSKRGMSNQLWDIIDDARLHEKEWWEGDPWVVNKLLTDLNHEAIYDTIPGARMGQDYLVGLAQLCNDKDGMKYTTPIYDIPVVQKKPKRKTDRVSTVLGALNIVQWIPNSLDKVAQKNGSAPNYIHSIDSTLLLRVIETMSNNIGVIHDCFISHANDGDELQLRFKEAFVEIMSMRPLELIGKQLDPEGVLEVPYIGTMDLSSVMDAEYIIS